MPGYSVTGHISFSGCSTSSPPSIPNVFEGNLIIEGADAPVGTIELVTVFSHVFSRGNRYFLIYIFQIYTRKYQAHNCRKYNDREKSGSYKLAI
jgi:hypothetical protein